MCIKLFSYSVRYAVQISQVRVNLKAQAKALSINSIFNIKENTSIFFNINKNSR